MTAARLRPRRVALVGMSELLASEAESLESLVERVFDVRVGADVAGLVSDYPTDRREIFQIGTPRRSDDPFFQPTRIRRGRPNVAEVPLGRLVYARRITDVLCVEDALRGLIASALAGHDVLVWMGATATAPGRVADPDAPRADKAAALAALRESLMAGVA